MLLLKHKNCLARMEASKKLICNITEKQSNPNTTSSNYEIFHLIFFDLEPWRRTLHLPTDVNVQRNNDVTTLRYSRHAE